jgi:hypothetical protein
MEVRRHFILDTGPLIEYLALVYEMRTGLPWPNRILNYHSLRGPVDRDAFGRFL